MAIFVDLKVLIKKLNSQLTTSLESCLAMCMTNGNYEITLEHWLYKLLSNHQDTELAVILNDNDIDIELVQRKLATSIKALEIGNTGKPLFSPFLLEIIQDAWTIGSLQFNCKNISSSFILLALLNNKNILSQLDVYDDFRMISKSKLIAEHDSIVINSGEDTLAKAADNSLAQSNKDSAISKYCENLTQKAREGKIDPIFGRELELDQMLDIFCKRRKNNPILVGEPGVGKTTIVEGLALRIAEDKVPEILKNTEILNLDLSLLEAGASVKGEFEKRLTSVIDEVKLSEKPLIVFIDEAHRLVGAGGQAGNDAANILKPALARGEFRTVAATTWKEYKQYFEKDPALSRRFQLVKLDIPNDTTTLTILRGLKDNYAQSHGVVIRDDALRMAVTLASKYITGKNQPDKSIDVIDTCAARVKISMSTQPSCIRHSYKKISALERELAGILSDAARGVGIDKEYEITLNTQVTQLKADVAKYETQWQQEKLLVNELQQIQAQLLDNTENLELITKNNQLSQQLAKLQQDNPLVFYEISPDIVAKVISDWTGIPLGKVLRDETQDLLSLDTMLCKAIKGQQPALQQIAQYLKISKAGLKTSEQPLGVFLLVGPSGVGKTETALTVAETLFGGQASVCTINMSEFQEQHSISRLIGSPPGYVGFGEGGILTEAVRQKPYSVVLLDEVEKASLDVMNLFYQVFDKGVLNDGEGQAIDFSNTVIFLTSNLATAEITNLTTANADISLEELTESIRPTLVNWFKPALLARTVVVPYRILNREALKAIVEKKITKLADYLYLNNKVELLFDDKVVNTIVNRCKDTATGARNIDIIMKSNLMPKLAEILLLHFYEKNKLNSITVSINDKGSFIYNY